MKFNYDPKLIVVNPSFRMVAETPEEEKFLEWFSVVYQYGSSSDSDIIPSPRLLTATPFYQHDLTREKYMDFKLDELEFRLAGNIEIPVKTKGISRVVATVTIKKD